MLNVFTMSPRNSISSTLHTESTFYEYLKRDLKKSKKEVIIESPFITQKRMAIVLPVMQTLRLKGVRIIINTKPFEEHETRYQEQVIWAIGLMQEMGAEILMTGGHHRKLAIIDDDVLWEGSLNILSQNYSCETMRRIHSNEAVEEMIQFTGIKKRC